MKSWETHWDRSIHAQGDCFEGEVETKSYDKKLFLVFKYHEICVAPHMSSILMICSKTQMLLLISLLYLLTHGPIINCLNEYFFININFFTSMFKLMQLHFKTVYKSMMIT